MAMSLAMGACGISVVEGRVPVAREAISFAMKIPRPEALQIVTWSGID
jgi:hypothetical protein